MSQSLKLYSVSNRIPVHTERNLFPRSTDETSVMVYVLVMPNQPVCFTANSLLIHINLLSICPSESCFNNTLDGHCFSLQNESLSETLLDKFSNMSATQNNSNDRIISRITIRKAEPANSQVVQSNLKAIQESNCQSLTIHEPNSSDHNYPSFEVKRGMVLGISVVQGPDNNVYVKDLIENGLGDLHGVLIGDQVSEHSN